MPLQLCPVVIGRVRELEALRNALLAAAAADGRCVVLLGEPGIGKSRLAREVADWATERGLAVATGRAVPASATAAFRPIAEALLQLLRDRTLPDDPTLAPWIGALQPLLPVLASQPVAAPDVSPAVRGEAVLQVLRRAHPAGAVIVLEDLHWADPDTVFLVEYLADNLSRERVLLVLTLRDSPPTAAMEMVRRQRGGGQLVHLGLERLSGEESDAMIRACAPEASDDLLQRIREAAEGVPLLVEELLTSPRPPGSFASTVISRLEALGADERSVIEAASMLGRQFDWQLLPAMTGQSEEAVVRALSNGVTSQLLSSRGTEIQFRHALTRDAVLESVLAPQQRELAAGAIEALLASKSPLDERSRETAIDLAVRAGDRRRAGIWLMDSGRQFLAWGALASAAEAMRRSAGLLAGCPEQSEAELGLLEALALAGRVDEAAATGGRLVTRLANDEAASGQRLLAHLQLARAGIAASRWQMARHHLRSARQLGGAEPPAEVANQIAVFEADVLIGGDEYEAAEQLAEQVVRSDGARPDSLCHAYEIIGRTRRSTTLAEGRRAFEQALIVAEAADLPLWRMRALHELGTIDLFDHAGVDRLLQARKAAEQGGAVTTVAILDLQLSAAFTCRWDLDACDAHARSAADAAERLGLDQVRAKALAFLVGSASMRADLAETERYAQLSLSAAPEDQMVKGLGLGGRAVALLLSGDTDGCLEPYRRAIGILSNVPHAEPATLRALWPVVLASIGDRRARPAIDEARRRGVAALNLNRGLLGYAEAILAGRAGDVRAANELVSIAEGGFSNCAGWLDIARFLAVPDASAGGWGDSERWLSEAVDRFDERGLTALRAQAKERLDRSRANPWADAGISAREADVLRLVGEGLSNKDIASRLHLSPRTVEKHLESLLRKASARSRTELVARLIRPATGTSR